MLSAVCQELSFSQKYVLVLTLACDAFVYAPIKAYSHIPSSFTAIARPIRNVSLPILSFSLLGHRSMLIQYEHNLIFFTHIRPLNNAASELRYLNHFSFLFILSDSYQS